MVPNRTIRKSLNEFCYQRKFTHRIHYHAICKVAHMLGVSVKFTLTLFDLEVFRDIVLNYTLGGSNFSPSRVLKMSNDQNTFGSCHLIFRAQFLASPAKHF